MTEIATKIIPNKRITKIDVDKAIQLRLKGYSDQAIANVFDCNRVSVYERLKGLVPHVTSLQAYKNNKADVFDAHALQILSTLTVDDIMEDKPRARIQSVKDLNEMARLERSQSTAIVETRSLNLNADVSNLFK